MSPARKTVRVRARLSPVLPFYIAMRVGFRFLGAKRRKALFERIGWLSLRCMILWFYLRFPKMARYLVKYWSEEDRLLSRLGGIRYSLIWGPT